MALAKAEEKEMQRLLNERDKHRGEWLTAEAVAAYQKRAAKLSASGNQDIGAWRTLRKELQERYGLLEIEAINILNGFHAAFYVEKYRRILNAIPWQTDPNKANLVETEDCFRTPRWGEKAPLGVVV